MSKGPSYRVPFRRRRQGKTDYKARRALIISKLPRVVSRGSLKNMSIQIVEATPTGDRIIVSADSRELKSYGWQAACGNLPAAYLTGLLCGVKAATKNVKKAVADIGLHQPTKGARIFASLKGVVDAGIDIPHSTEKLPDDKRLQGKHIADYAKSLASSNAELYEKSFSQYSKNKLSPENLIEHFDVVKEKIIATTKKEKTVHAPKKERTTKTRKKVKSP